MDSSSWRAMVSQRSARVVVLSVWMAVTESMIRPWIYAIVVGETKGVGKSLVDLIAGKVLLRRAEMVLSLAGQMVKATIPWLLDSASKRWASRSLWCIRGWSSATIGTLTGRVPSNRQRFSAKIHASYVLVCTKYIPVYEIQSSDILNYTKHIQVEHCI